MQGELLAHGPHLPGAPLPGPGTTAAHITLQTLEGEHPADPVSMGLGSGSILLPKWPSLLLQEDAHLRPGCPG